MGHRRMRRAGGDLLSYADRRALGDRVCDYSVGTLPMVGTLCRWIRYLRVLILGRTMAATWGISANEVWSGEPVAPAPAQTGSVSGA
jgi:hypothetical protein